MAGVSCCFEPLSYSSAGRGDYVCPGTHPQPGGALRGAPIEPVCIHLFKGISTWYLVLRVPRAPQPQNTILLPFCGLSHAPFPPEHRTRPRRRQCQPELTWVSGKAQAHVSTKSWLRFCLRKSGGSGVTDATPSFQLAAAPGAPAHFSKQVACVPPVSFSVTIVLQAARIKYAKYSWQRWRQLTDVTSPCTVRGGKGRGLLKKNGHFSSL